MHITLSPLRRLLIGLGWFPLAAWVACRGMAAPEVSQPVQTLTVPACDATREKQQIPVEGGKVLVCVAVEGGFRWESFP